jgi:hypothetical protein
MHASCMHGRLWAPQGPCYLSSQPGKSMQSALPVLTALASSATAKAATPARRPILPPKGRQMQGKSFTFAATQNRMEPHSHFQRFLTVRC